MCVNNNSYIAIQSNLPAAKLAYSRAATRDDGAFASFVQRTSEQCGQTIAALMLEPIHLLFVHRGTLVAWLRCLPTSDVERAPLVRAFHGVTDLLDDIHERDRLLQLVPVGWLANVARVTKYK